MSSISTIAYTKTDEAPALATHSLLPILRAFTTGTGIDFELKDISLAGRILSHFPDALKPDQRVSDALSELGQLATRPEANIVKLPNVSASVPQLQDAVKELQSKGYSVPDFPTDPQSDEDQAVRATYAKVLGSAVNPVLREGNSDRRVAKPVKAYAQKNPHSMGSWASDSKTHVAHMRSGDFYGSEKSVVIKQDSTVKIEFINSSGEKKTLKEGLLLLEGEVIDASAMDRSALRSFLAEQLDDALEENVLFSLHMKATMMKVSDPIIFGHCVEAYLGDVLEEFENEFTSAGFNPNNGLSDFYQVLETMSPEKQSAIQSKLEEELGNRPALAMVNSDKGITNLHVPSDVIIDASMPAMIRTSGRMWGPDGNPKDTKAVIPDRNYAGVYQSTIDFCKEHGAFDVTTMGNVANVGLMAKKAEEYGSHDKTFEIEQPGTIRVLDENGNELLSHEVHTGDLWRMCQTKKVAIVDWVKLAVTRARLSGNPVIFWLDENRPHDANLISYVQAELPQLDTAGLDLSILPPIEATKATCQRCKNGLDTISATGNVLRDYLTDLFPILELGTSAKMLSIVPLLAGGGLFETGAGGSAPKHVQQFVEEGHLRWDSLGEFLAIGVSLEDLAEKSGNAKAKVLADCLNDAIGKFLDENKSPSRKVNELDNRGSHFYLALFWAEALAGQEGDSELQERFGSFANTLRKNEQAIVEELNAAQGKPVDLGGYYLPDERKASAAMRPSALFNDALDGLS
ncbi:MAG: isocitrate dehydrogenase (NADP(+)) [Opitutae bacterium]|nr:isocitrate dehydrogenase (NADP(+)) [Opitutae bacterium]|tara:strand:+ start:6039 stop:8267 length:2229 start_codon:yes stop_codon:yes gene_type:complete